MKPETGHQKAQKDDSIIRQSNFEDIILTPAQQKVLLESARSAITSYLDKGAISYIQTADPVLNRPAGVFVTLRIYDLPPYFSHSKLPPPKEGFLRGCVGHLQADASLIRAVQEMAVKSAVSDPRFPPMMPDEVDRIRIDISILSPLQQVVDLHQVAIGIHGLVIENKADRRGVLLPKVAVNWNWDLEEFLENLCKKAGISRDDWPENATLFSFMTIDFGEPLKES